MTIIINGTTGVDTPAITGLTTALSAAQGGTGLASVGTSGNVLTSNGTTWTSSALPAGGVTSLNGETGAIVNTTNFAIGSYLVGRQANQTNIAINTTVAGSTLYATSDDVYYSTNFFNRRNDTAASVTLANVGTWRAMTSCYGVSGFAVSGLWVRIS